VESEKTPLLWYAVYTRSRWEHRIADALRQKGLEVFLPTYGTAKPSSRGYIGAPPALFPGYLFCRLDITKRLSVITVNGVLSILGVGQNPEPVPDHELDSVRKLVESGMTLCPNAVLAPGQSILVEYGPLKGVTGTLIQTVRESLLLVSISMLNRSVAVRLKPEWVTSNRNLQALVASRPMQSHGFVPMG
jgi:transcription antitermination factor NusG